MQRRWRVWIGCAVLVGVCGSCGSATGTHTGGAAGSKAASGAGGSQSSGSGGRVTSGNGGNGGNGGLGGATGGRTAGSGNAAGSVAGHAGTAASSGGSGTSAGGGPGGAGGGVTPPPSSTGDFPFPGRWWAHLTGPIGPGGAAGGQGGVGGTAGIGGRGGSSFPTEYGGFVIHWSDTDPNDRGLWTPLARYGIDASPGLEGGTTISTKSPDMRACWTLFATSDPDVLEVRACGYPPSSGAPALGVFRRGPGRLVAEVPFAPGGGPISPVGLDALAPGGRSFTFAIARELYLWRADARQTIDLGGAGAAAFSPNDQRLVFYLRQPDQSVTSEAYDATAATFTKLGTVVPGRTPMLDDRTAIFSPDSRRAVLYANADSTGFIGDLVAFDFATGAKVTVKAQVNMDALPRVVNFLSGDRVLVSTQAPGFSPAPPRETTGYDFATSTSRSFGASDFVTPIPGGAFAAFRTPGGDVTLINAATWQTRVLGSTVVPPTVSAAEAGLQPSPDGKWLAFLDGTQALHVWDLTTVTETVNLADGSQTYTDSSVTFARPTSGYFTTDSRAFIHQARGSGATMSLTNIARLDLASRTETFVDIGTGLDAGPTAFSRMGQVAYTSARSRQWPQLVNWQDSPIALTMPPAPLSGAADPVFTFTDDERYLFYSANNQLMVRDGQSGAMNQMVPFNVAAAIFTSPARGVAAIWDVFQLMDAPLTAYLAAGGSQVLARYAYRPFSSPSKNAIAYKVEDAGGKGVYHYPFDATAPPRLIGNGTPLAISDHAVVFQDLDGVCVFTY